MAKSCPICGASYPDSNSFCTKDGSTLRAEESSEDLVGTIIADRYKVTRLLGEGGMGRVYLARHVRLPQQAAIKVLHPSMVKEADAVARFNREAGNAARIEHDRVARVFDFGETTDGLVYLAMEYVPGRTLRDMLFDGPLTPARAANITYQVADGLSAAHRIGIVHRDLKPDNILVVTDESGVDRSKVVDFGIAKAVDSAQTQLTKTGMMVGTPEFMSPEQVLGESLDARSDVYSLALVSFQLFTGLLPYSGTTPERTLAARLMEDAATLGDKAPQIAWPAELQSVFTHALARDPAERTATAIEFGEAVVAAVETWTGSAVLRGRTPMSSPSLMSAMSTPASALPATVPDTPLSIASSDKAAPAASSSAKGDAPYATTSNTQSAITAQRKSRAPLIAGGGVLVAAAVAALVYTGTGSNGGSNASTSDSLNTMVAVTQQDTTVSAKQDTPLPNEASGNSGVSARVSEANETSSNSTNPRADVHSSNNVERAPVSSVPESPNNTSSISTADALEVERIKNAIAVSDDPIRASEAVASLTRMLPRQRTVADSFQVLKTRFEARMLATDGDRVVSCPDLITANRLAQRLGDAERKAVQAFASFCPL